MIKLFLLLTTLTLVSCNQEKNVGIEKNLDKKDIKEIPIEKKTDDRIDLNSNQFGVYVIQFDNFIRDNIEKEIIYSLNNDTVKISSNNLHIHDTIISLFNSPENLLSKYSNAKIFDPEFNMIIYEAIKSVDGSIYLNSYDSIILKSFSRYIKFITYDQYFSNKLIGINWDTKLYEDTVSKIIVNDTNYVDYYYEIISINDNWLHVKTEPEASGKNLKGWVRWKEKIEGFEKVFVEIIYKI